MIKFVPKLDFTNLIELDIQQYHEIVLELSKIDRERIEDELDVFPGVYGYYYGLLARANRLLDGSTLARDSFRSAKKNELRKQPGKHTVESLNDQLNADLDAKQLDIEVADIQEIYSLVKGICSTLEHKKDMLVQLSANKRQEIKLHG